MAKAPSPAHSVITESPMSGLASSCVQPSSKTPTGICDGPVNQRSPSPETRIPNSVPLRDSVVTIDEPSIPAASHIAFDAAMTGFRIANQLRPMNWSAFSFTSAVASDAAIAGATWRKSISEPA